MNSEPGSERLIEERLGTACKDESLEELKKIPAPPTTMLARLFVLATVFLSFSVDIEDGVVVMLTFVSSSVGRGWRKEKKERRKRLITTPNQIFHNNTECSDDFFCPAPP